MAGTLETLDEWINELATTTERMQGKSADEIRKAAVALHKNTLYLFRKNPNSADAVRAQMLSWYVNAGNFGSRDADIIDFLTRRFKRTTGNGYEDRCSWNGLLFQLLHTALTVRALLLSTGYVTDDEEVELTEVLALHTLPSGKDFDAVQERLRLKSEIKDIGMNSLPILIRELELPQRVITEPEWKNILHHQANTLHIATDSQDQVRGFSQYKLMDPSPVIEEPMPIGDFTLDMCMSTQSMKLKTCSVQKIGWDTNDDSMAVSFILVAISHLLQESRERVLRMNIQYP